MKSKFWIFKIALAIGLVGQPLIGHADRISAADSTGASTKGGAKLDYAVVEASGHYNILQANEIIAGEDGTTTTNVHRITELGSGLNYFNDETRKWEPAVAEFEIDPDKGAVAKRLYQQVQIAGDPSQPAAVSVTTPDLQQLKSHIVGLSLFDPITGAQEIIAELKKTPQGQILGTKDKVVFPDCFDSMNADLVYEIRRESFSQDVVLHQQIDPADWKFPAGSVLEIWTEFDQAPEPQKELRVIYQEPDPNLRAGMVEPDQTDEGLMFGELLFANGQAFKSPDLRSVVLTSAREPGTLVTKHFLAIDGRKFLVEGISLKDLIPLQKELPQAPKNQAARRKEIHRGRRELALSIPKNNRTPQSRPLRVAEITKDAHAVVLDYTVLSTTTNLTLAAGSTYLLTGTAQISGLLTIEGGAVIKNNGTLQVFATIDCRTTPARPVIFTSKNDDSIGEVIPGSTGNPINGSGGDPAILVQNLSSDLHDIRVSYAARGIYYLSTVGISHVLRNAQVNHATAIGIQLYDAPAPGYLSLYNVFVEAETSAFYGRNLKMDGTHLTVKNATNFLEFYTSDCTAALTNSLLVGLANVSTNVTQVQCTSYTNAASVFQTVGAGALYNRFDVTNSCSTNGLPAVLLADLKQRTVFPPTVLTNPITADLTLSTRVPRDSGFTVAAGYHYLPLDYVLSGVLVSNASLTISNGLNIGWYGTNAVQLSGDGKLISQGSPIAKNYFIRYNVAQEGANTNWVSGIRYLAYADPSTTPASEFRFNFTELSLTAPTGTEGYFFGANNTTTIQNSEFYNGAFISIPPGTIYHRADVVNNLFYRVSNLIFGDSSNGNANSNLTLNFKNNSMITGFLGVYGGSNNNSFEVRDNVFDSGKRAGLCQVATNSNNAYTASFPVLGGSLGNDVTNFVSSYQTGPLGYFYQSSTSAVINAGSRNATNAGLYWFTTTTNQAIEGNSTVDIGYHYVALTNGVPIDTDNEGLANYFEDINGNGTWNTGETDWQQVDTDYDGRNDYQEEISDSTIPTDSNSVIPLRLAYWKFDTTNFLGEAGQVPLLSTNLSNPGSFSGYGKAVEVSSNNAALQYRDVEVNGSANINRRNGTVRFVFKPNWTSGTGPGFTTTSTPTLLSMGLPSATKTNWWALYANTNGTSLTFASEANSSVVTNWTTPISWTTGNWYQVALTYSPTGSILFVNGTQMVTSASAPLYPDSVKRGAVGFFVGGTQGGTNRANGQFDELETFNYVLSTNQINGDYQIKAPLSLVILSPTNTQVFANSPTNVPISVGASDPLGSIAKVELYSGTNTTAFATIPATNGTNFNFTWTNQTAGAYAIWAKATANRPETNYSDVRIFRINTAGNTFPSVSITNPVNGAILNPAASFVIKATASDSGGSITNVAFYRGTNLLANDPYSPFELTCNGWDPGTYTLTAKATDNTGLKNSSTNVTITIALWGPQPQIGRWDPELPIPDAIDASNDIATSLRTDSSNRLYAAFFDLDNGHSPSTVFYLNSMNCSWDSLGVPNGTTNAALRWEPFSLEISSQGILAGGKRDTGEGPGSMNFSALHLWNGSQWIDWWEGDSTDTGIPLDEEPNTVSTISNIKGDIYAGGSFVSIGTNTALQFIVRRTSTNWITVGNGLNGPVRAIANIGDTLYVGGDFTSAGGNSSIKYIARLTNGAWASVGSGLDVGALTNGVVRTMITRGSELFVGGSFAKAGGDTNANCLARWDGKNWTWLARGFSFPEAPDEIPTVRAIAVRGADIYVGGEFSTITTADGELTTSHIAKVSWSEERQKWLWSTMDGGVYRSGGNGGPIGVETLAIVEGPNSNTYDVFVGGRIDHAGDYPVETVARWMVGTSSCNDPLGLTVQINSPTNGVTVTNGVTLTLQATTHVNSGTNDSLDFFVDNSSAIYGTPGVGGTYSATWPAVSGVHQVRAVAVSGTHTKTSASATVTVVDTNSIIIANPDAFTILNDGYPSVLPVTTNDVGLGFACSLGWRLGDRYFAGTSGSRFTPIQCHQCDLQSPSRSFWHGQLCLCNNERLK